MIDLRRRACAVRCGCGAREALSRRAARPRVHPLNGLAIAHDADDREIDDAGGRLAQGLRLQTNTAIARRCVMVRTETVAVCSDLAVFAAEGVRFQSSRFRSLARRGMLGAQARRSRNR